MIVCAARVVLSAQSPASAVDDRLSIATSGELLRVKARDLRFIQGEAVSRLKDGHPVRFEFELSVLTRPDGGVVTHSRQSFNLSYDLWEERFAVTRLGSPSTSISHLTLPAAEAWCLEHVAVPLKPLRGSIAGRPFWIRVDYRVHAPEADAGQEAEAMLTLRRMIEMLSRRPKSGESGHATAGPFRLE